MNPGDVTAWFATALFPSTAVAGLVLRRFLTGAFTIRLRPRTVHTLDDYERNGSLSGKEDALKCTRAHERFAEFVGQR